MFRQVKPSIFKYLPVDDEFSFSSTAQKPAGTTAPSSFGGSLFGQPNTAQTQTPATGGLFGAQTQTQAQNPSTSGSLFGAQSSNTTGGTATTGGLFGTQPTASTTTGTSGSLFGGQPNPGNTGTTTGGLFGAQPQTQSGTTTTGGLFGQTQTQQQQQPSFGFGGATTTTAPAQQQAQPTGPFTRTTKFNDLPDAQKKIFEELESFIQGRVQISVELKAQKLGEEIAKEQVVLDDLSKSLANATSALAADRLAADDQRTKTERNLQDALAATRIIDGFTRPQQMGGYLTSYANFPLEYFTRQVEEMKERVQRYKSTMEQIERKLTTAHESHTPQPAQPSPQAIANALRAQHQSFMALAARTAEIDAAVQRHKSTYTARWRAQTGSARDPFSTGSGREEDTLDALMSMSASVVGR